MPSRGDAPSGLDRVSRPDDPFGKDMRPEPRAMDQAGPHPLLRELLEMPARLAQAHPPQADAPDGKLPPHEVVERDPARDDVPPAVAGVDGDSVITLDGLNGFDADQRDLAAGPGGRREGAQLGEVPVPVQPLARDGADLFDGDHASRRRRGDVDGEHGALEHPRGLPIAPGGAARCLLGGWASNILVPRGRRTETTPGAESRPGPRFDRDRLSGARRVSIQLTRPVEARRWSQPSSRR